jgi:hypothetical protein
MNPLQSTMGPDRLVKSPPISQGAVSPMGNLFEAILLLAGCVYSGITDRLPPPVLFNILSKTAITTQVTTEGTCKAITEKPQHLLNASSGPPRQGPIGPKHNRFKVAKHLLDGQEEKA